jgi:long-chain fatty acid transport protein
MQKQGCAHMNSRKIIVSLLVLSCAPQWCFASFLANPYQSASAMGNAFAGAASSGDDASINYYNPAGLMLIEEAQVVGVMSYAFADAEFTVDSLKDTNRNPIPDVEGEQISAVPNEVIPALHMAAPINEDYVLGMSITGPFGGVTDYSDTPARFTANYTSLLTYNANLSLARQMTEELSLGVGANVQYLTTKVNAYLGNDNAQQQEDLVFMEYSGDDVAFYPNVGLLYEFSENTRAGLAYVFPVNHNAEGDVSIDIIPRDQTIDEPAAANFLFPDSLTLSIFHQLTEKVELMSDVIFTHWSRFDNLVIANQIPGVSQTLVDAPLGLTNTWRISVGASYQYTPVIKLRGGLAYDQSPVHDEDRYAQAPDSNRVDASIGMSLAPKSWEKMRLDFAYLHSFFAPASVDQSSILDGLDVLPPNPHALVGTYNTSADIISAQIVYIM